MPDRKEPEVEFDEYVAVRGTALLRFAYLLARDSHTAEDLVQSALADAYRHWKKVQRADHPDAYVRRMVLNRHLGWRRRRWSSETPTASVPDHTVTRADPADDVAARDQIRRLLADLPPRTRAVLVLRYYEGLDDRAIAELLGISDSTVRAAASRALGRLRTSLAEPDPAGRESS